MTSCFHVCIRVPLPRLFLIICVALTSREPRGPWTEWYYSSALKYCFRTSNETEHLCLSEKISKSGEERRGAVRRASSREEKSTEAKEKRAAVDPWNIHDIIIAYSRNARLATLKCYPIYFRSAANRKVNKGRRNCCNWILAFPLPIARSVWTYFEPSSAPLCSHRPFVGYSIASVDPATAAPLQFAVSRRSHWPNCSECSAFRRTFDDIKNA